MSDDIEHLKVHKIVHRKDDGRVALGVVGQQATSEPAVREAFGGGETEVAAIRTETLRAQIIEALKGIHDPEIPVNIYDLGLIYGFEIDAERNVELEMTLTAPACPVAGVLVQRQNLVHHRGGRCSVELEMRLQQPLDGGALAGGKITVPCRRLDHQGGRGVDTVAFLHLRMR